VNSSVDEADFCFDWCVCYRSVCMSSDHGELLGDHNDFGKSKPWQGAIGVPLICAGPGLAVGRSVGRPVGTVDLAATFMDYAGAAPAPGMTAVSMRPMLDAGNMGRREAQVHAAYKPYIKSGLLNFRLVVQQMSDGKSYKLVCCKGACPGPPSTIHKQNKRGYTSSLTCVEDDPYDMHPIRNATAEALLVPLLPPDFAKGCA
jgi:arylsulfatase A-like enzyme